LWKTGEKGGGTVRNFQRKRKGTGGRQEEADHPEMRIPYQMKVGGEVPIASASGKEGEVPERAGKEEKKA